MAKSAPAKKAAAKKTPAAKKAATSRTALITDPRESGPANPEPVNIQPSETPADRSQVDDGTDTILPRRATGKKKADEKTVTVVKAFRLTDEKGEHKYPVGTYGMPKDHAEHWYAQAFLAGEDDEE